LKIFISALKCAIEKKAASAAFFTPVRCGSPLATPAKCCGFTRAEVLCKTFLINAAIACPAN
jgi:hypothetical protein